MQSAITMLKEDHKTVRQLFRQFHATSETAYQTRKKIGDHIISELEQHSSLEEQIFYPAVDAKSKDKGRKHVAEAYEEHALMKQLMNELKRADPSERKYAAKFKVLCDVVEHHVKEEEGRIFPEAKKVLKEDEKVLGVTMRQRREELMKSKEGFLARLVA